MSRHISVEDVRVQLPDAEDGADMQWLRRMVFTSNRNLTQSEAYLIPAIAANSSQVQNTKLSSSYAWHL